MCNQCWRRNAYYPFLTTGLIMKCMRMRTRWYQSESVCANYGALSLKPNSQLGFQSPFYPKLDSALHITTYIKIASYPHSLKRYLLIQSTHSAYLLSLHTTLPAMFWLQCPLLTSCREWLSQLSKGCIVRSNQGMQTMHQKNVVMLLSSDYSISCHRM